LVIKANFVFSGSPACFFAQPGINMLKNKAETNK
jgi:hypothetical protein